MTSFTWKVLAKSWGQSFEKLRLSVVRSKKLKFPKYTHLRIDITFCFLVSNLYESILSSKEMLLEIRTVIKIS